MESKNTRLELSHEKKLNPTESHYVQYVPSEDCLSFEETFKTDEQFQSLFNFRNCLLISDNDYVNKHFDCDIQNTVGGKKILIRTRG